MEVEANDPTDIDCVLKFIREQTEAAEIFSRLKVAEKPKQAPNNLQQKQTPPPATASQLATGVRINLTNPLKQNQKSETNFSPFNTGAREVTRPCIFCTQGHWPSKFHKNLKERKTFIAELQRCTNCFEKRHANKDCTSPRNCNRCGGRHHKHYVSGRTQDSQTYPEPEHPAPQYQEMQQPSPQHVLVLIMVLNFCWLICGKGYILQQTFFCSGHHILLITAKVRI